MNNINLSTLKCDPWDIIVASYGEPRTYREMMEIHNQIKSVFPNNDVLLFPNDIVIQQMDVDDLSNIITKLTDRLERIRRKNYQGGE